MRFNFNYDGITLDLTIEFSERDYTNFFTSFIELGSQLDEAKHAEEWENQKTRVVHSFIVKFCEMTLHTMLLDDAFSDKIFVEIKDRGTQNFLKVHHCRHQDDLGTCEIFHGCQLGALVNVRQCLCERCGNFYMEGHHTICIF